VGQSKLANQFDDRSKRMTITQSKSAIGYQIPIYGAKKLHQDKSTGSLLNQSAKQNPSGRI
tara:strand:+ start:174 stop:356 length:183 start_codon:yes stop_codon:yes gene_type:complete